MACWYCCNRGDALLATVQQEQMRHSFIAHYTVAQLTDAEAPAALFASHRSDGRLHCELLLYFSPAAEELAKQWGAYPCRRPPPDNLGLLAGLSSAWARLFPRAPTDATALPGETP